MLFFVSTLFIGCSNEQPKEDYTLQQNIETEKEMETQYLKFLANSCEAYQSNITDIQNLFRELQANSSVIGQKDWNQKINDRYENIEEIHNKLMNLPYVPEKFKNLHEETKDAVRSTLESRVKIFEGFKQMNVEMVNEGGVLMQESKKRISGVQSIIERGDS